MTIVGHISVVGGGGGGWWLCIPGNRKVLVRTTSMRIDGSVKGGHDDGWVVVVVPRCVSSFDIGTRNTH